MISFTIPGRIGGKGRGRVSIRGGYARVYTPQKTRSQEAEVKWFAIDAMNGHKMFEGPVSLHIVMMLNTPASWSKKRKATALHVTGKPDCDNIIKLIGDSLNAVVWKDDSQVAEIWFRRLYANDGPEAVTISIASLL